MAFQVGKATKRSRFGEVTIQQQKTTETAEFCVRAGLDFHFVDAEWEKNYMHANELDNLLTATEAASSDLTTVITINARHECAFNLTKDYVEVMQQRDNVGLCFVAGNSAYLTPQERRLDADSRIVELVKTSRNSLPRAAIFVGSEGLNGLSRELAAKYSTIPFMLLGPHIHDQAAEFIHGAAGSAVYCPCYMSSNNEDGLVNTLGPYALRRKWVRKVLRSKGFGVSEVRSKISSGAHPDRRARRILAEAIRELALCDINQTRDMLRKLSSSGVKYAAVLLAEENDAQSDVLSKLLGYLS